MTKNELLRLIADALRATLDKDVEFDPATDLVAGKVLDSLDGIRFLFELEQLTGVKFADEDVATGKLWQVDALMDYVLAKRESQS